MFTTIMVVVPSLREEDFKNNYMLMEGVAREKAKVTEAKHRKKLEEEAKAEGRVLEEQKEKKKEDCLNVVPGSAIRLFPKPGAETTGEEFVLYRIVIMRKGLATIKRVCRENRFTVREYQYDSTAVQNAAKAKALLLRQKDQAWSFLQALCRTSFSELFQFWIHLKAIRCFVESVLRFGLPINICASTIQLKRASDAPRVRQILGELYKGLDQSNLTADLEGGEMDISGFGSDFYPYVYLTLKL